MNPSELSSTFLGLRPHRAAAPALRDLAPGEHFVQFYQEDRVLVDSVTAFFVAGLSRGEVAIIIAIPEHRAAVERQIHAAGIDLAAALAAGRFSSLDAAGTLAQFMVNGTPHPQKFFDVVGGLVAKASSAGTGLRAFGEMVALLWAQGNCKAALQLEELWNELGRIHTFSLFCGYPRSAFKGEAAVQPWLHVCQAHSRVI